jgi:hypothetical protein
MTPDQYLREVATELRDLPWKQRRELVAELRTHLGELPAGENEMETPAEYAAHLCEAAGLERRRGVIAFLRARRPLYVVLVALALIVLGFAIGAVAWINSYQPIVYGNQTQFPFGATSSAGQAGDTVVFRNGHPFLYGITIRNDRRFAVRILGVTSNPGHWSYFRGRLFTSKPTVNDDERPLVPFHPFDLQPGQERWLVFKGHFACTIGQMAPGGATTWEDVGVRYRFLWRTATAVIPLDDPLEISFPQGGCAPGARR